MGEPSLKPYEIYHYKGFVPLLNSEGVTLPETNTLPLQKYGKSQKRKDRLPTTIIQGLYGCFQK